MFLSIPSLILTPARVDWARLNGLKLQVAPDDHAEMFRKWGVLSKQIQSHLQAACRAEILPLLFLWSAEPVSLQCKATVYHPK